MRNLELEKLDKFFLNRSIVERFKMTETYIDEQISNLVKIDVFDKINNSLAFSFNTDEEEDSVLTRLKKEILLYIKEDYRKNGYIPGVVKLSRLGIGTYKEYPNAIVFVKGSNNYTFIEEMIYYKKNNQMLVESLFGELREISKDEYIEVGYIC